MAHEGDTAEDSDKEGIEKEGERAEVEELDEPPEQVFIYGSCVCEVPGVHRVILINFHHIVAAVMILP